MLRDSLAVAGAMVVVVSAVLACKGRSDAASSDSGPAASTTAVAAVASSAPAPSASASASAAVKHPAARQPAPKGCPEGWTRTTKGICVDWCETNDDCDDPKTCQDSPHIDPDLGKIKTCQAPPSAAASAVPPSSAPDTVAPKGDTCPDNYNGPMQDGKCHKLCTTAKDCHGKNSCIMDPIGGHYCDLGGMAP